MYRRCLVLCGLGFVTFSLFSQQTLIAQDSAPKSIEKKPSNLASDASPSHANVEPTHLSLATNSPLPTHPSPLVMGKWITEFSADQDSIRARFRIANSDETLTLKNRLFDEWLARLGSLAFSSLQHEDQVDYVLLRNEIVHRQDLLKRDQRKHSDATKLVPYLGDLTRLCLARENVQPIPPPEIAMTLQRLQDQAIELTKALNQKKDDKNSNKSSTLSESNHSSVSIDPVPTSAIASVQILRQSIRNLDESHRFYSGYDPSYSWWVDKPFQDCKAAIEKHAEAIQRVLGGVDEKDKDKIVGQPIGEDALKEELRYAMIPYDANELVAIAEREFIWCDDQFKKAATDLGLDGDWKKALEYVKGLHVEPGQQPQLIRDLAWEAMRFLEAHDLVTVPTLAANGWRMEMMSPEAQRSNPYFLGGPLIIVSFPTQGMTHQEKLMSLRSNNIHFARATVHHELIPGHHLQHYMKARYRPYRELFDTPFWVEGWALYWEMLLWDLDFHQSAEDRVGMLFWRRHRCARIVFSLNYHLGKWSPEKCVDYLIDRVGHEPSAAQAEVRRSVMGNYGPLYQAAYMLGGLQLRGLHRELVQTGKMTNRVFHDEVIQQNSIPIEMIRAALTRAPLNPNYQTQWRFAD